MKKNILSGLDKTKKFYWIFGFHVDMPLLFPTICLLLNLLKLSNKISKCVGLCISLEIFGVWSCKAIGKVCTSLVVSRLIVDIIESVQSSNNEQEPD